METNKNHKKTKMPIQNPMIRIQNFLEVALGYTEEQAKEEARRCVRCKNPPCVQGCPVGIAIPDFIRMIAEGNNEIAYEILSKDTCFPAICGRVCPQETQCEKNCVRGKKGEPVAIGRLERFAADQMLVREKSAGLLTFNKYKIAIIGSGPSGLSCAGELAKKGYEITIFEALHKVGGVLSYGIPEFRLPKKIVHAEINRLKNMGVKILTNMVIGKVLSIRELLNEQSFSAVFIGSGAGLPKFMNIPGENFKGVCSANEFLTRINLMNAWQPGSATPVQKAKNVAVIGGGNVAMDAARCAKRLGAEKVSVVYRRSEAELPARAEEAAHAREEGIVFQLLTNPKRILGDENRNVTGIECVRMELGAPDTDGRRRPVPQPGSEFILDADCVIMAIGTSPNPLIKSTTEHLAVEQWGGIIVEENTGKTSLEGVYAGGDAVTGAATVIQAMSAGKTAAKAIDSYLRAL